MRRGLTALISGVLFSTGLCVSGMTQPSKVLAFLDFIGPWDPSLAFVMVGAIGVSALAFRASARRSAPVLGDRFRLGTRTARIGWRLIVGSALFGVGWGMIGLCPGPAVTSMVTGLPGPWIFVGAMLAGTLLADVLGPRDLPGLAVDDSSSSISQARAFVGFLIGG
jgi:uncharacterized membrane protein YedE/YeeE